MTAEEIIVSADPQPALQHDAMSKLQLPNLRKSEVCTTALLDRMSELECTNHDRAPVRLALSHLSRSPSRRRAVDPRVAIRDSSHATVPY